MASTDANMISSTQRILSAPFRVAIIVAMLGCLSLVAFPCAAQTIFVNNQVGNDRFDGQSAKPTGRGLGPVETIRRAIELANSGGRIVIANTDQPYYENIALFGHKSSGTLRKPFRIEGQGAILDGTVPVSDRAWENVDGALFRFKPQQLAPQVLFHEGRPLPQVTPEPGSIARPRLTPGQWCYHDGYMYFRVEGEKVPELYQLRYAGRGAGVLLYRVDGVEISGLTIQGFQFDGVQVKDTTSKIKLVGLNLRGNGRSGLSVGGASRVAAEKCLIGNNGRVQVRTEGYSRTELTDCDVLDNTAPAYDVRGRKFFVNGKPYDRRPPGDSAGQ